MKNASQIINSIQNRPQFFKLSRYNSIKKTESIFTLALQNMIKSTYIKNNRLKQESDNNIQNIKSALNFHMPQECNKTLEIPIKTNHDS